MAIGLVQNTNIHNKKRNSIIIFEKNQAKRGGALTYSNNIMFALVKDNNILEL
jgi:predicted outer membrane repeat protein